MSIQLKTLKTPMPSFSDVFGQKAAPETVQMLSVSMPISFPWNWTPDVEDRIWPGLWAPGVNHQSPQAEDCKIAVPCWERSGNYVSDVIAGYIGQAYLRPSLTGFTLAQYLWDDDTGDCSGPTIRGTGYITYGQQSFDLSQGFSICWWGTFGAPGGDIAQYLFKCGGWYVTVDADSYYPEINCQFPIATGTFGCFWILPESQTMYEYPYMKHFCITSTPVVYPEIDATLTNAAYYDTSGSFVTNYFVIVGQSGTTYEERGIIGFTLNAQRNQPLGTCTLSLPGGGVGTAYPVSVRVQVVNDGNPTFPTNNSTALSGASNLYGAHVDYTFTGNSTTVNLDVTSMVQAMVDLPTWASGNKVVFYLQRLLTDPSGGHYISANGNGTGTVSLTVAAVNNGQITRLYINGEQIGGDQDSPNSTDRPTNTSGELFLLGPDNNLVSATNHMWRGAVKDFRLYDKPLTYGAIQDIYRIPEDLYSQPVTVLDAAGFVVFDDLSGEIDSTSSLSGSMVVMHNLSGTIASTSSLSSTLATEVGLAGTIASTSSLSGTANVIYRLGGTIASASSLSGTLQKQHNCTGTIRSTSTVTAKIGFIRSLGGEFDSTSSLSGGLLKYKPLAGTIQSTSNLTGAASLHANCQGTITSTSTLAGRLGVKQSLAGTISSTSSLGGRLGTKPAIDISGTIRSTSNLTGTAKVIHNLGGTIASTSSLAGHVGFKQDLSGTVASTSTLSGDFIRTARIRGTIASSSTLNGGMLVTRNLAGTIQSTSNLAGGINLSPIHTLSGTIRSTSSLTGTAKVIHNLGGTIASTSSLAGHVGFKQDLSGTITSTSSLSGQASLRLSVGGTIQSTSSLNGAAALQANLKGTIRSTSNLTGNVYRIQSLNGRIRSGSNLRGNLAGFFNLGGTIASTSKLTGKFQQPDPRPLTYEVVPWMAQQLNIQLYPVLLPTADLTLLPAITYTRTKTDFRYYLYNHSDTRITEIDFDIWAMTQGEILEISQRLVDLLNGFKGRLGTVNIKRTTITNIYDQYADEIGPKQGIIRSITVEFAHTHRTDVADYSLTNEAQLVSTIENVVDYIVTYNPYISDAKPLVTISRTAPGYDQYIGENNPFRLNDFTITVQAAHYKPCVDCLELIRLHLGQGPQNLYDTHDIDSADRPIFECNLEISI